MQIKFRLDLNSDRVRQNLLQGMDNWVRLGLLSDEQVKELAATLSERLPTPRPSPTAQRSLTSSGEPAFKDFITAERELALATAESTAVADSGEVSDEVSSPTRASGLSRALQSLLSEISVIWLLFLGVFLVVVSSGVLAASQWQSFSAVGQYAILFAYTLTFWGASLWTGRRDQLQTTAKMLSLATALLIPINFWMIDALSVFGSIAGIGFGVLAAVILSLIASKLLNSRLNKLNLIGLSWLQFGWLAGAGFWPVVATYLGTVGSAANLFYQDRQPSVSEPIGSDDDALSESQRSRSGRFSFDPLTVAIAITILLFRSLFITQVPPHQLGLAAGICGGLAIWLSRTKATRRFWNFAGFGLLFLGWAVSNSQSPPWQAIGVSAIALWLLKDKLQQTWKSSYLFAVIGVACQAYGLLWPVLPAPARTHLLTALSHIKGSPLDSDVWVSLGLFPLVLALLFLAAWLRRLQQGKLAKQTELIALLMGTGLTLLSFSSSPTAVANLTLSTLTLIAVGRSRQSLAIATLTHAAGLMAIATSIHYFAPGLTTQGWTYVALGSGAIEILAHLISRSDRWRKNLWFGGIGLLAIAYLLLVIHYHQQPHWLWLPVPILFSAIANHRRTLYPKTAAVLSTGALILQTPWIFLTWTTAIVNFAIATLFAGFNSRIWRTLPATLFAVGEAIALVNSILLYGLSKLPDLDAGWVLSLYAVEIWALWLLPRLISRRSGLLSALYQKSCLLWSFALLALFALTQTVVATVTFPPAPGAPPQEPLAYSIFAAILLAAALIENIHHRPAEWKYWSLGWTIASVVVFGLLNHGTIGAKEHGIAFLILAFIAQIMGDLWVKKHPGYRLSWHGIPFLYALIGGGLGHLVTYAPLAGDLSTGELSNSWLALSAETGLYTLATAIIFTAIGRRNPKLSSLSYLGLLAFTAGAYELLIYQLSQASSGSLGDGVTLLAALALVIALLEKWLSPWLQRYLKLSMAAVQNTAHLHWLFSNILSVLALSVGLSQPHGTRLWLIISLFLAAYALMVGNRRWTPQTFVTNHSNWTSIGLLEILLCLAFSRYELFFDSAALLIWAGVIACIAGAVIYRLPWERWGWPLRPFRLFSIWLPMLTIATTVLQIKIPGLLAVSAFYAWMAKACNRIRLSYLSILLLDWAILDYLDGQSLLTALGVALIAGLSVLYVAQVDPYFQTIQQRQQRHLLRILASVAIALTALYQAETADPMLLYAGLTLILCLGFIFSGLTLKVRAFLYVGTLTFVVQIVRVLWLFISAYSLLLWAVGIVLGLIFIWIAATFESRRSQVTQLLDTWTAALDTWD